MKTLAHWSWSDIQRVYADFGKQLDEYKRLAPIFGVDEPVDLTPRPGMIIPVSSFAKVLWVAAWYRDVNRINDQIKVLDREIARRNRLIGVIG